MGNVWEYKGKMLILSKWEKTMHFGGILKHLDKVFIAKSCSIQV